MGGMRFRLLYLLRQGLFGVRRTFCSESLVIFRGTRCISLSSDANVSYCKTDNRSFRMVFSKNLFDMSESYLKFPITYWCNFYFDIFKSYFHFLHQLFWIANFTCKSDEWLDKGLSVVIIHYFSICGWDCYTI